MRLFKPFHPIHLEISAPHRQNDTMKYKVFVSLQLEVPPSSEADKLCAVVINRANFDPPTNQNISAFSFLMGS